MTTPALPAPRPFFRLDNRYLAPILVTLVLVIGQISFGFLESWSRTFLAIATAILVEVVLGRLFFGAWPHLASSYISGISIGMPGGYGTTPTATVRPPISSTGTCSTSLRTSWW